MSFVQFTWRELQQEMRHLLRAPLPLLSATVFPLAAWIVIALTMQHPSIEHLPVIVVDQDGSSLSRTLIRSMDATQALRVTEVTRDEADAREQLEHGDAILIVHIPSDLEQNIKSGSSVQCTILANGAQLLYSRIAYRAVATSITTISTGIQIRRLSARGMTAEQARNRAMPVSTEIHAMGNSWYDYAYYLVPGMMLAILQMSASFSTLWLFREHRDRDARLITPKAGRGVVFFIARGLPLLAANTVAVLLLFLVIFPWAGLSYSSIFPPMFLRTMFFVLVSMGLGALLSVLFRNLISAAQISLIINAPAFVFSGYTFPRWAMPEGIRLFAECFPLTHLLDSLIPLLVFSEGSTAGLLPLILFFLLFWGIVVVLISSWGQRMRSAAARNITELGARFLPDALAK